jgi:hypothetical protein
LPADANGQPFLALWVANGFQLLAGVLYRAAQYALLVKAAPPNGAIRPTAVSVGGTPTLLPTTALANRERLIVYNNGSATVYLGGSTVTTSTGLPVLPGAAWTLDCGPDQAVYAIAQAGTQNVRVLEQAS